MLFFIPILIILLRKTKLDPPLKSHLVPSAIVNLTVLAVICFFYHSYFCHLSCLILLQQINLKKQGRQSAIVKDLNTLDRSNIVLLFNQLLLYLCLLYTSPSPRDLSTSRMPSSA